MPAFTVYKRDHAGQIIFSYSGVVVQSERRFVCIEAVFTSRDKVDIADLLTLVRGDRMLERFYADRWYNIFQVHDGQSDVIKGWYCNITRPAEITEKAVAADDLALDVVVTPSGRFNLLDEDEFEMLDLPPEERAAAWNAVDELRALVNNRQEPFVSIGT